MTDAHKKLKELTAELGRLDAQCDNLQKWNPDHLATRHYLCVNRREDIEGRIGFWRKQADGVTA